MVDALLDTAIVVDLQREYQPAAGWIASTDEILGITKLVLMEVVQGCYNKQDLTKTIRLIERFKLVEIKAKDIDWGSEKLIEFNLSHNVEVLDCLIGATSHRLQIPLYTRNLKHFKPLLGELAQKPY